MFPRAAKSIALSAEARDVLGHRPPTCHAGELRRTSILRAPVDLLWNGGIGTYVKASPNPMPRSVTVRTTAFASTAPELRCRVVGEGGNLGLTQRGRVEYALNGGFVNTDAIDNSAGVDCCDHEVNIKILLDAAVADGEMTIESATPARRDDRRGGRSGTRGQPRPDDHVGHRPPCRRYRWSTCMPVTCTRWRRKAHQPPLEYLPTDKQIADRQASGIGLTTPEFAVLLAYTKTTNVDEILASGLPDDPDVQDELAAYFPRAALSGSPAGSATIGLHREIIATRVVNTMVNRSGTSFDHRMLEETGSTVPDVTRAYVARDASCASASSGRRSKRWKRRSPALCNWSCSSAFGS